LGVLTQVVLVVSRISDVAPLTVLRVPEKLLMVLILSVCLQGKGLQLTYWLHGKKGYDKPLPAFDKFVYTFLLSVMSITEIHAHLFCRTPAFELPAHFVNIAHSIGKFKGAARPPNTGRTNHSVAR